LNDCNNPSRTERVAVSLSLSTSPHPLSLSLSVIKHTSMTPLQGQPLAASNH